MGCQKNIAKEINEADADYVLALKGNHETAHGEISTYLRDLVVEKESRAGTRGRLFATKPQRGGERP